MKRKLVTLLLVLGCTLGLGTAVACNKGSTSDTTTSSSSSSSSIQQGVRALEYTLSTDGTYYVVKGMGNVSDTDIVIPSTYKDLPVKEIGERAFTSKVGRTLTSVTIEEGITTVGTSAFDGCELLKTVSLPASVTTLKNNVFSGCYLLESVTFGQNGKLTDIGDAAFASCKSLTSIALPSGVESIGRQAFSKCESLTGILLPDTVGSLGESAFVQCYNLLSVNIPHNLSTIEGSTFSQCYNLTAITIPQNVTQIKSSAFSGCYRLVDVYNQTSLPIHVMGDDYGEVAKHALAVANNSDYTSPFVEKDGFLFYYLYLSSEPTYYLVNYVGSATNPVLPESIEGYTYQINKYAFYKNTKITSVTLPQNLEWIGKCAFYECSGLTDVYFNTNLTYNLTNLGYVFEHAGREGEPFTLHVGANATKIPSYLFEYCENLTSVVFDENSVCESIEENAFIGCSALSSVVMPDSLQTIGSYAFQNCSHLANLTLPNGPTLSIGANAFVGCNLTSITLDYTTCTVGEDAFDSLTSVTFKGNFTLAEGAFSCPSLTEVNLQGNPTMSVTSAFAGAGTSGEGITLHVGAEVTQIPENLFAHASGSSAPKLKAVVFAENSLCQSIGGSAFAGVTGLTDFTLPDGIAFSIGARAFYESSLTSVSLGNAVTSIGQQAFSRSALQSATVQSGTIATSAFETCSQLTTLTLGENATLASTAQYVFKDCTALSVINLNTRALGVNSLGFPFDNAGTSGEGITIHVGAGVEYFPGYLSAKSTYGARPKFTGVVFAENSVCQAIGESAFEYCTTLTSIALPDSVQTIAEYAFRGCTGLESVTFGANSLLSSINVKAFYGCTSLESIAIPDDVTEIPFATFEGCTSLASVTFGEDSLLQSVRENAFYGCSVLSEVIFPSGITTIEENAYALCSGLSKVVFPTSSPVLATIGDYAFYNCGISNLSPIPDSVQTIGQGAFRGGSYPNLWIGSGVQTIGDSAFSSSGLNNIIFNATAVNDLTSEESAFITGSLTNCTVKFGANVTKIPAYLFNGLRSQEGHKKIVFENVATCQSIGVRAFYGFTGTQTSVYIDNVGAWCTINFGDSYANPLSAGTNSKLYVNGSWEYELDIPIGVTEIKPYAFYSYENISYVNIPASVTKIHANAFTYSKMFGVTFAENSTLDSIEESAFYNCTYLSEIVFPDSLTKIGASAFQSCTDLSSIVIPANVNLIGERAFQGCTSLTSVTFTNPENWEAVYTNYSTDLTLTDAETNATYLKSTYNGVSWQRTA